MGERAEECETILIGNVARRNITLRNWNNIQYHGGILAPHLNAETMQIKCNDFATEKHPPG